jgi:hypothetical protein
VTIRSRGRLPEGDAKRFYFTDRAWRSVWIILTMAYLPVTSLAIEALSCDPDRLITRPEIECFTGDHVIVAAVACFFLAAQTIAYPLLVLRYLRRNKALLHTDERVMERWNFFYEFYNPNHPTFWIVEYPILIIVAAGNSVLKPHVNYQMSISVAVFAYKLLYICVRRPFIDWITDVIQAVMALVSLVLINMTFFSRHGLLDKLPAVREGLLVAVFGLFVLAIAAIIAYIVWLAFAKTVLGLGKDDGDSDSGGGAAHGNDAFEDLDGDLDGDGADGLGDGLADADPGFLQSTWSGIEGFFLGLFGGGGNGAAVEGGGAGDNGAGDNGAGDGVDPAAVSVDIDAATGGGGEDDMLEEPPAEDGADQQPPGVIAWITGMLSAGGSAAEGDQAGAGATPGLVEDDIVSPRV